MHQLMNGRTRVLCGLALLIVTSGVLIGAGALKDVEPLEHAVLWISGDRCTYQSNIGMRSASTTTEYDTLAKELNLTGEASGTSIAFWDRLEANGWHTLDTHPGSGDWAGSLQVVLGR